MSSYKLKAIKKSTRKDKKLMAIFENPDNKQTKTIHFGANNMSDYRIHKDIERKNRYLARHKKNEDWNNPYTAGALSRWILWNKPTLKDSIDDYKRRFF